MTLKDWLTIAVTIAGLYLGPKIAVKLALKQFHQQKIWERRVEVYQNVIGDMSILYNYYAEGFMAIVNQRQPPPITSESESALKNLARHANAGGFIISVEAEHALSTVMGALVGTEYHNNQEKFDSISANLSENIDIVKRCARQDCNISIP